VVYGYATPVTHAAEKDYAVKLVTDTVLPGRWEDSRVPPTKAEQDSTGILKVRIVSASAKVRAEGVGKEDRADALNTPLRDNTWTGVVPMWTAYGVPQPADENRRADVPDYIQEFIRRKNDQGRKLVGAQEEAKGGLLSWLGAGKS